MTISIKDVDNYSDIGTKSSTFAGHQTACVVIWGLRCNDGLNAPSCTCDGSAMTIAESETLSNERAATYIFYKLNVGLGAKNIVLSYTPVGTTNHAITILALAGVNQISPIAQTKDAYNCYNAGTYNMAFTAADINGLMVSAASSNSGGITFNSAGYTQYSQVSGFAITEYKLAPAINESVSWIFGEAGNSACATAFAAVPSLGGEPVAVSPFFNFFKTFENPWLKKGGLWLPKTTGFVTI